MTQAATGHATLVALVIAVCGGSVVLIPSLALLFTLFLRGRLDTPEHPVTEVTTSPGNPPAPAATSSPAQSAPPTRPAPPTYRTRAWTSAALAGLVAGAGLLIFANPPLHDHSDSSATHGLTSGLSGSGVRSE